MHEDAQYPSNDRINWVQSCTVGAALMFVMSAIASGLGCSSTTNTTAAASMGGDGGSDGNGHASGGRSSTGLGAAGAIADGGATGTAAGGAAGAANCTAALVPDLHAACIEDLGQGKVRITYDFSSADQAQDWSAATDSTVKLLQRALVITNNNGIGAAIFVKKLHVDKAMFSVTLLSGNTTNWYINTIWSGSWNPAAGYGAYHDNTGRGFIINGTEYAPSDVAPLSIGVIHKNAIEQTDAALAWDQDGKSMSESVTPLPVTDRSFALGAWDSSAAFYDVVFEGTLN